MPGAEDHNHWLDVLWLALACLAVVPILLRGTSRAVKVMLLVGLVLLVASLVLGHDAEGLTALLLLHGLAGVMLLWGHVLNIRHRLARRSCVTA